MNKQFIATVMAGLMIGCSSEWRTNQPTTPITYKVPAYRGDRTVGNLLWLAILPVQRNQCGIFGTDCQSETADMMKAYDIASYLSEEKGYKVKVVADEAGVWRPDIIVKSEFGSTDELKKAWESARTDDEISAAARALGASLQVDGVVVLSAQNPVVRRASPAAIAVAAAFIIPLLVVAPFLAMYEEWGRTRSEAVIYEAISGREVWRHSSSRPATVGHFRNLENAIPAQVIQ